MNNMMYSPSTATEVLELPNPSVPDLEPKREEKSFLTWGFYQQYFEVTTEQVVSRILRACVPRRATTFYDQCIRRNPDLYGPIWISLTLVFTFAMTGNVGSYFHSGNDSKSHWKYDFHLISVAASTILAYTWLLPLVLWGFLKWQTDNQVNVSYIELACLYGYCLATFLPVSLLWIIQVAWFQWTVVLVGASLSITTLLSSLVSMLGSKNLFLLAIVWFCHMIFSMLLMLHFCPTD